MVAISVSCQWFPHLVLALVARGPWPRAAGPSARRAQARSTPTARRMSRSCRACAHSPRHPNTTKPIDLPGFRSPTRSGDPERALHLTTPSEGEGPCSDRQDIAAGTCHRADQTHSDRARCAERRTAGSARGRRIGPGAFPAPRSGPTQRVSCDGEPCWIAAEVGLVRLSCSSERQMSIR